MDLFGLVEVENPDRPVMPWCPAAVRHRFFGDAMCALMAIRLRSPWSIFVSRQVAADEEEGEEQEDEEGMPRFGLWQPIFQPYFPEWRENLVLPEPEPREGTFVFRVSVGKVW